MFGGIPRMLFIVVGVLAALYFAVVCFFWAVQRSILFPAPARAERPALAGTEIWQLANPASPGPVHAWYAPAREGMPTVVHFHGNGEQLSTQAPLLNRHRQAGIGFLAVEYPGYGLSAAGGQSPTEEGIYAAAAAALDELQGRRGVPVSRTVLSGRSLGTGVAVEMARRGRGARLELVSPYPSIAEIAADRFPFLPARLLVRDRFDSASKAADVHAPVLVIYGSADEEIPAALTLRLAARFAIIETYVVAAGRHNSLFDQDPGVVTRLLAFAARAGAAPPAAP